VCRERKVKGYQKKDGLANTEGKKGKKGMRGKESRNEVKKTVKSLNHKNPRGS